MGLVRVIAGVVLAVVGAVLLLVPPFVSANYTLVTATLVAGIFCVLAALLALEHHQRT
jgi:hypothetical protein